MKLKTGITLILWDEGQVRRALCNKGAAKGKRNYSLARKAFSGHWKALQFVPLFLILPFSL
jgi:hypothetical protein